MKHTVKIAALLLTIFALASCERELSEEEKAARFTYPDKSGEAEVLYNEGDTVTDGDFTFTVDPNGDLTLTEYRGSGTTVIIPEKSEGMRVTAVGDGVFAENSTLTTVEFSRYVTEIGDRAFFNCVNLLRILGTDNVKYVGAHAFTGTAAASYSDKEFVTVGSDILVAYKGQGGAVTVPEGIRIISTAFAGREGITEIKLPRSLKYIGSSAFEVCCDLVSIDVPGGTVAIGDRAFAGCAALTDIYIPFDVSELGENIFDECSGALEVLCMAGSPAESYCLEHGIHIKE